MAPPEALPQPTPSAPKRIKVPPLYEQIMRWLFTNPGRTLQEGARAHGVTPSWFSSVVNSDLFIARYQEWMRELDEANALPKLAEKVAGTTALALEKLSTALELTNDPEVIVRAADVLLKATKVQAPTVQVTQNTQNVFQLDARLAAVQDARRAALEAARGPANPVTDLVEVAVPLAEGVLMDRMQVIPARKTVEFGPPPQPSAEQVLKAFDDK